MKVAFASVRDPKEKRGIADGPDESRSCGLTPALNAWRRSDETEEVKAYGVLFPCDP